MCIYVCEYKIQLPMPVRGIMSLGDGYRGCCELPDGILGNKFISSVRATDSLKPWA